MTARTIMRFMIELKMNYITAAGQVMITRDEIWYPSESTAFRDAFVEMYGDISECWELPERKSANQ